MMPRYVTLTQDGRIGATTLQGYQSGNDLLYNFPADFNFEAQTDWRIVDGELVYDPLPGPEPAPDYAAFLAGIMEGYSDE